MFRYDQHLQRDTLSNEESYQLYQSTGRVVPQQDLIDCFHQVFEFHPIYVVSLCLGFSFYTCHKDMSV